MFEHGSMAGLETAWIDGRACCSAIQLVTTHEYKAELVRVSMRYNIQHANNTLKYKLKDIF